MQPPLQIRLPFFILTIVMALLMGGFLGYIIANQMIWNQQQTQRSPLGQGVPASGAIPAPSPEAASGQLPEGHPPINPEPTIAAMKAEIEKSPASLEKITQLANFLYDNKRYKDAIDWYEKALKLNPKNPDVETDMGTAYYYVGDFNSALSHFDSSLRIDPRHIQTIHNKFIVLLDGKKDLAGARATLKQLESIDPQNPALAGLRKMLQDAEKGI
ncbi:MAG: tetratricopeptide repeat protein [Acidobacteriia bacterium]|nr:tetratricopeptide repeat protein [Terriglobia bacterium]